MDLRRLNHLVLLSEEGSFGKAAERAHLTQPAFSRSIQAAEAEWALRLFDRGSAKVRCTPAGSFAVERARQVLQAARALERDVLLYRDMQIGDLSFGMGPFAAAGLLTPLMLHLRKRFPQMQFRAQVSNPVYLLPCIRREEHDFFVGDVRYAEPDDDGTFEVKRLGRIPGGLYARKDHPLLESSPVRMAQLVPYGFATGQLPSKVNTLLLELLGLAPDDRLPVAVDCDDFNVLKSVALATDAVLVATPDMVHRDLEAGRLHVLKPVDFPDQSSDLGVISLRGRSLSPVASYAVNFLGELMTRRGPHARKRPARPESP
jgi:DNA-binding transcriptional LysR family regulator